MNRNLHLLIFVTLAVLASACTAFQFQSSEFKGDPRTWIDAPLDASSLPLAQVEIISHSADPFGVTQMELSVNGKPVRVDPAGGAGSQKLFVTTRQLWNPTAAGNYTLLVRAQNTYGVWGDPAQVVVTIGLAPTPAQTATPTRPATAAPAPVFTLTPLPPVSLAFFADQTTLTPGQCTTLHWQVTNVSQVFLDNASAGASGNKQICPAQSETHTLRVITLDQQTVERTVRITIVPLTATRTPTRTPTLTSTSTRTPLPTAIPTQVIK